MQCAVKGAIAGKGSREMSRDCKELEIALDKFGYVDPMVLERQLVEVEENKEAHLRKLFEFGYEAYDLIQ
jgi:hypothetical protein